MRATTTQPSDSGATATIISKPDLRPIGCILAEQIKKHQPERWQRFHQNRKILVVDDNSGTIFRLTRSLEYLYGYNKVDSATDKDDVVGKICEAKEDGTPYDLVVLDIHMPRKSGIEVMKELGRDCPAVVFNSASMMRPVMADLSIAMDRFTAQNALDLIAEHVLEQRPASVPLAPIFINLKDEPLDILVNKIDAALMIADNMPNSAQALGEFLEVFNPRLFPVTFSANIVHEIMEELRNRLPEIEKAVLQLKADYELESSAWWETNGLPLAETLKALKELRFSDINEENPAQTWNEVHALFGSLMNLSPNGVILPSYGDPEPILEYWKTEYSYLYNIITRIADPLRAQAHDEVQIPKVLAEIMPADFSFDSDVKNTPHIHDENRLISSLLKKMLAVYGERLNRQQQKWKPAVNISYTKEDERFKEPEEITRLLTKISAGAFFEISFIDSADFRFEETFSNLAPQLSELRRANKIAWREEQSTDGINRFYLYVKVTEQTVDYLDFEPNLESLLAANQASRIGDMEVFQNMGSQQNMTFIEKLAGQIELDDKSVGYSFGVVYEHAGEIIFAEGKRHLEAAEKIALYLSCKQETASFDEKTSAPRVLDIYHNGVRIDFKGPAFKIEVEKVADLDKSKRARDALIASGILEVRINLSDNFFGYAL